MFIHFDWHGACTYVSHFIQCIFSSVVWWCLCCCLSEQDGCWVRQLLVHLMQYGVASWAGLLCIFWCKLICFTDVSRAMCVLHVLGSVQTLCVLAMYIPEMVKEHPVTECSVKKMKVDHDIPWFLICLDWIRFNNILYVDCICIMWMYSSHKSWILIVSVYALWLFLFVSHRLNYCIDV